MRFNIFMLCVFALTVTACTNTTNTQQAIMLTPPPVARVQDPSDAALQSAVQSYLRSQGAPAFAQYQYHRVDLDGDARRDAIVVLHTPYQYWCGDHGCTMVVMKADSNTTFAPISKSAPVRTPLYMASTSTNGWKDIIVPVSGRMERRKDVLMTFDGRGYPQDPSTLSGIKPQENIMMASQNKIFP